MLISLSLRFLFVERRNGRPRIKMAEKGSPSMTSTLFCFPPPCYFVFRHLYKTSAEKEEDIYFPDGRSFFFFPALPTSSSFLCHGTRGGGGRRDRRFFLKRNIYLIFLFPFKKTNCIHKFLFLKKNFIFLLFLWFFKINDTSASKLSGLVKSQQETEK
jgi:hypothetical protein